MTDVELTDVELTDDELTDDELTNSDCIAESGVPRLGRREVEERKLRGHDSHGNSIVLDSKGAQWEMASESDRVGAIILLV